MAHPLLFDDGDPVLARVRALCLAFPGADEKISHGRPVFFTTKIFCEYGCSVKVAGTWVQHPRSIVMLPDAGEHEALLGDARFFAPGYLGAYGWVALDLDDDTDWGEVAELVDSSYRHTAPRAWRADSTPDGLCYPAFAGLFCSASRFFLAASTDARRAATRSTTSA